MIPCFKGAPCVASEPRGARRVPRLGDHQHETKLDKDESCMEGRPDGRSISLSRNSRVSIGWWVEMDREDLTVKWIDQKSVPRRTGACFLTVGGGLRNTERARAKINSLVLDQNWVYRNKLMVFNADR